MLYTLIECVVLYKLHTCNFDSCYRILLVICREKVSCFLQITLQLQKLFGERVHMDTMKARKAGNDKSFSEMKVKM